MKFGIFCAIACFGAFAGGAEAHEGHTQHAASESAIGLTTDAQGSIWQAQVKQGQLWVSHSEDRGVHFSAPVAVNAQPMRVAAEGEARPKIAVADNGYVYLTWTESLKTPYAGYIWFARSTDHGNSFEPPYIVHRDRAEITHRFDALQLAPDGSITVLWVDKRDLLAAKAAGKAYDGAAIYYALSTDQGKSFQPEQKLADSSCECCRLATAAQADGTVAVMWRHVFAGSERDHALAEIKPGSKPVPVRASYGHWKIDGCPHHGATLARGEGFGYHMAYFDGAGDKPGLRLARMDSQAWVTSPPKRFGDAKRHASHPVLASSGNQVWLAWREQAASGMEIWQMSSSDGGKNWSNPSKRLSADGKLDYPFLLNVKGQMTVCANSRQGLLCNDME